MLISRIRDLSFQETGSPAGAYRTGLDESLKLIALLFGEDMAAKVQLNTEYFPKPPGGGDIPPPDDCIVKWQ
jgi:hypothetical protein